ncbi:hypothetical protein L21SP3_01524 [Sedimentisphaera cyanobacteriorum]|uniref:Uncharacterized protein n=1 Tax=Sedimentisphaera cyanobacteriorum TaxID=1940790 RepID=A0A1Q2HR18_9BACT|nr:hypothetical protein [Sedimentisphaera cyanobacteriorum]AQQ09714.1 hypothetical protein L21SP3_01524 [Sedimentisphaera cyanobacteriorum]
MTVRKANKKLSMLAAAGVMALAVFFAGCDKQTADNQAENQAAERSSAEITRKAETKAALENSQIEDYQNQLMEIAFQTASMIPVKPHIKDRSKSQQKVVKAYIELGQIKTAAEQTKKILNWRKGVCFGELAYYFAENNQKGRANEFIALAEEVIEEPNLEDWRRDRVKVRIAQAETLLGNDSHSEQFEENLVEAETGKVAATKAEICSEQEFDSQLASIDEMIKTGVYDIVKNALYACFELYERFYENSSRRQMLEDKITSSWKTIPYFIRIDLLVKMAEANIDGGNTAKAVELIDKARQMITSGKWRLENRMPLTAKVAAARFKAGQKEKAVKEADEEIELFKEQKEKIVDIYRSEALTSIAEACVSMDRREKAAEIYAMAVKEGAENPNSRPTAIDLCDVCCSMAKHKVNPSEKLLAEIKEVKGSLSVPW